jgi:hypothetical protein
MMALPAVALAAVDKFKGEGTEQPKTLVRFDVRGKDSIESFRAEQVRYHCDERKSFRANPPEFPRDIDVDSKGEFDDNYTLTDEDNKVKIKFKGKVEGKLVHRKGVKSDKKGDKNRKSDKDEYNKAKGEMEFHARYKSDGDRCESRPIDWKAKIF